MLLARHCAGDKSPQSDVVYRQLQAKFSETKSITIHGAVIPARPQRLLDMLCHFVRPGTVGWSACRKCFSWTFAEFAHGYVVAQMCTKSALELRR